MKPEIKLCKDCRHYSAGKDVLSDTCLHDEAIQPSGSWVVRGGEHQYFSCTSMRAGICSNARLFELKEAENILSVAYGLDREIPVSLRKDCDRDSEPGDEYGRQHGDN